MLLQQLKKAHNHTSYAVLLQWVLVKQHQSKNNFTLKDVNEA
jgi:hypothetical protein